jgi:hypothetical protein
MWSGLGRSFRSAGAAELEGSSSLFSRGSFRPSLQGLGLAFVAWNKLIAAPDRIRSIATREWAKTVTS